MFHKSKLTPISRTMGLMSMVCPVCENTFSRYASQVRAADVCCCSRACAAKAREVRISTKCVVCEKEMQLIPSDLEKKTTCSKTCSSLRKRSSHPKARSFKAYKDAAERIGNRGVCEHCGKKHGPFVVRDLKAVIAEDGEVTVDETKAELWCRQCHLESIALSGGNANGARFIETKEV